MSDDEGSARPIDPTVAQILATEAVKDLYKRVGGFFQDESSARSIGTEAETATPSEEHPLADAGREPFGTVPPEALDGVNRRQGAHPEGLDDV